jgi:hypothetical protein
VFWLLRSIVVNLNEKQIKDRWESWNPDIIIPAIFTGGSAGFLGGAALAGAVSDVVFSFGAVTITLGAAAIANFLYERHKRHKKGEELTRFWRAQMRGS